MGYHKNTENATDLLLHQHITFTYFLQPTTTIIPPVQRSRKEFLPSFHQGRIATKREQQDWHQQEPWLQLTCELRQGWCSVTFSDHLWSHQCEGSKKSSRTQTRSSKLLLLPMVHLPLLHVVVELHAAAFVVKKRVRSCTRQLLHRW